MLINIEDLLKIQKEIESGKRKLETLSDDELIELDKLYDKQLKDIEAKYENKKNVFRKIYLEYKKAN